MLDGEEQLATFDVGGGPEPLFAEGVYGAESTDDRTYRWFGGPEGVTRGAFPETDLEAATAVRLEGNPPPIDSQTVALSVNGTGTGTLEMTESPGTYDLSAVA